MNFFYYGNLGFLLMFKKIVSPKKSNFGEDLSGEDFWKLNSLAKEYWKLETSWELKGLNKGSPPVILL